MAKYITFCVVNIVQRQYTLLFSKYPNALYMASNYSAASSEKKCHPYIFMTLQNPMGHNKNNQN